MLSTKKRIGEAHFRASWNEDGGGSEADYFGALKKKVYVEHRSFIAIFAASLSYFHLLSVCLSVCQCSQSTIIVYVAFFFCSRDS